ncbi:nuclear transport factor 2 family protein [Gaetbulibacter sp. M240]|uniref:nuclear transport factor 2 family protein n=1 Tax=Gaetbulibacter sp. M240 TaxID=3126511 RepID=UPI00374FB3B2
MKTKTMLLAILTLFYLTSSCTNKIDDQAEQSNVQKTIKKLYKSFEQKDINLMSEVMAHDESMLSFGTSISDVHMNWEEWKQNHINQFKAFDSAKINSKNLNVYLNQTGNVSWFADIGDWEIVMQSDTIQISDVRITGVLEKRDDLWKIVQIHASVPQGE